MTTIDNTPTLGQTLESGKPEHAPDDAVAVESGGSAEPELAFVPITELQPHPHNVREDLKITPEWVAGIRENGIDVPLKVRRLPDGVLQISMGHRRYFGALEAGVTFLPCVIVDAAGQRAGSAFTDMYRENRDREGLTAFEEAEALFNAFEEGMSKTTIRKVTGLAATQVKAAVKAGGMTRETRERISRQHRTLSLEEQAIYAEFDGDEAALTELLDKTRWSGTERLAYFAQVIRERRAEEARVAAVRAELAEQGIAVTDGLPRGAALLSDLCQDGAGLTPEQHAQCEGRSAYFERFTDPTVPIYYCSSPDKYGHQRPELEPAARTDAGPARPQMVVPVVEPQLVRRGNTEWRAAAVVRAEFVTSLLARKKAPAEVIRFVAEQIVNMPEPLCKALGGARTMSSFTTLTAMTAASAARACTTATAARLPLVMLGPIATAYEHQIAGDGDRVNTWRTDRWAVCSRADAGTWLRFLAGLGYALSPIEQAVADDRPYTGDDPAATGRSAGRATHRSEPAADDAGDHDDRAASQTVPGDTEEASPQPATEAA